MAHIDDRKAALIAQLAAQRRHLSSSALGVRESLHVGRRIQSSVAQHRGVWAAGAALTGLALTRLFSRKPARFRPAARMLQGSAHAGFAWPAIKLVFDLARPALISLLTARIADFVSGRSRTARSARN